MTKAEALATLDNVLQNWVVGMATAHFSQQVAPTLERFRMKVVGPAGELHINANDVGRALLSEATGAQIIEEYKAALRRMIVREAHEVALWYGSRTNQKSAVTSAWWFPFSRIVRNAVSHKQVGIMNMWPKDLAGQQVTWRGRTLDASMVGQPIDLTDGEILLLFHDIRDFINSLS